MPTNLIATTLLYNFMQINLNFPCPSYKYMIVRVYVVQALKSRIRIYFFQSSTERESAGDGCSLLVPVFPESLLPISFPGR